MKKAFYTHSTSKNEKNLTITISTFQEWELGRPVLEDDLILFPEVEHSYTLCSSNSTPAQDKFLHMCIYSFMIHEHEALCSTTPRQLSPQQ